MKLRQSTIRIDAWRDHCRVRVTHKPTGLWAESADHPDQRKNKETAYAELMRRLDERLDGEGD
jgi:protein subunit release factor A